MANFFTQIVGRLIVPKGQKPDEATDNTWLVPPQPRQVHASASQLAKRAQDLIREQSQSADLKKGAMDIDAPADQTGLIPPRGARTIRIPGNDPFTLNPSSQPGSVNSNTAIPSGGLVPPSRTNATASERRPERSAKVQFREASIDRAAIDHGGLIPPSRVQTSGDMAQAEETSVPMLRLRKRD